MKKELTLEQAMDRLDEIVLSLDDGGLALEQALKLFEEGTTLVRQCNDKMKDAQLKVETLTGRLMPEQQQE